jgi:hypothetical protein
MDPSDGRHTIIDVREYFVCVWLTETSSWCSWCRKWWWPQG